MDDKKNIINGIVNALIYLIVTILIPFLTFSWIKNLEVSGFAITLTQTKYENIIFYVLAFGLLITGTAFFAYSSPSQSIRRAVLSLVQIVLNCLYVWSYRFSGALAIDFELAGYGSVIINLEEMIKIYLGLYLLTIILKIYDIAEFSINRFKIREERERKKLEKENKVAKKEAKKEAKKAKKDDKKVAKTSKKEAKKETKSAQKENNKEVKMK
ncbi:MAG: hypothetical protein ACFFAS_03975 [Promethearchaeota archaeon]